MPGSRPRNRGIKSPTLSTINPHAAGIDVGATFHVVAIPPDRDDRPVRTFAAVSIGRTQTALGAFYRRLAARIGKAKAVTATARKLAILFYNALRFGLAYADPGASYYEDRYRRRVIDNLQRRPRHFGFTLVADPAAE